MRFEYVEIKEWPRLAWLAILKPRQHTVEVLHGPWVETRKDWFCEAAWDGEFSSGDFDRTDIVTGSGGRLRGGDVRFVSSGSNLDRLHSFCTTNESVVSNSYCCLLAALGARADLGFRDYGALFASYRFAFFGEYKRVLPSTVGDIHLAYFADLVWSGGELQEVEKPQGDRRFDSFYEYVEFLKSCTTSVLSNARDRQRTRVFSALCPLSKGYDSPAVAVLARDSGPVTTFTFPWDRDGRDDSGEFLASLLDLPCHVVDRDAWRKSVLPEIPFLAGSGSVGDMAFKSAEELLGQSVLLNGVGGVPVWDCSDIDRGRQAVGDGALLSLIEYRLLMGFFNAPVPLWGIRQLSEIKKISNSAEMKAWSVGGNYNKPICRRLLEEAGVPRGTFATGKSGVSFAPEALSKLLLPESRANFLNWLDNAKDWGKGCGVTVPKSFAARAMDGALTPLSNMIWKLLKSDARHGLGAFRAVRAPLSAVRRKLRQPYYHHRLLVHWAVDHMVTKYGTSGLAYRERQELAVRSDASDGRTMEPGQEHTLFGRYNRNQR